MENNPPWILESINPKVNEWKMRTKIKITNLRLRILDFKKIVFKDDIHLDYILKGYWTNKYGFYSTLVNYYRNFVFYCYVSYEKEKRSVIISYSCVRYAIKNAVFHKRREGDTKARVSNW